MSKKIAKELDQVIQNNSDHGVNTIVKVSVAKQRIKLPANVMLFQAFAYLAATKLKPATNKVLMLLFSHSAYENYIGIDVVTISESLEMSERSVLRALKELEVNNIILKFKHPSDKRRNDYFINPTASWKGNSFTRKESMKAIEEKDKNQLEMFEGDLKPENLLQK